MVIMVYDTLQMHYSSPILTRLTYIITHVWMHYICMCMYIMAYMCIHRYSCYGFIYVLWVYKCFHISIYIYAVFFLCMCVCVSMYGRMKVW